jgi:hypothetical protein
MLNEPVIKIEQIVITLNDTYVVEILRGLPALRAAIKIHRTGVWIVIRAINYRFARLITFVFLTTRK